MSSSAVSVRHFHEGLSLSPKGGEKNLITQLNVSTTTGGGWVSRK
jgi:hypothetical protein